MFCGPGCKYWRGSCGERFDGPEGWVAAADGYSKPDVSAPALLADYRKIIDEYTARTQRPLHHVRDFLDCVKSRQPTTYTAETMHLLHTTLLMGDISIRLGRKLNWDPKKEEFIDDDAANAMRSRQARTDWGKVG